MSDLPSSASVNIPPTARITVDLDALARNYRELCRLAQPAGCAAVVKADAYGLGVDAVAARLKAEGCTTFFVATAGEAIELGPSLDSQAIGVFEGVPEGAEPLYLARGFLPVLNTPAEVKRWVAAGRGARVPAILHIDTGMTRLGLAADEVHWLAEQKGLLDQLDLRFIMTHLACADEPDHQLTETQIARFDQLRALLPAAPTSIGNSAGLLRGAATCGDLARPGIALYGGQVLTGAGFTPHPVVHWQARVLQVRDVTEPTTVGYNATHRALPPARVATVAVGYADGYMRSLGNRGAVCIGKRRAPVVGRVSMDLITVDVSEFEPGEVGAGTWVDLIGDGMGLDELAEAADTISYEILTRLGARAQRVYLGDVR